MKIPHITHVHMSKIEYRIPDSLSMKELPDKGLGKTRAQEATQTEDEMKSSKNHKENFKRAIFISVFIHALVLLEIPSLAFKHSQSREELTDRDIDFFLTHLLPRSQPSEIPQNSASAGQQREETKENKVIRYVYDVVKPKVYENLKAQLSRVGRLDDVTISIEVMKDGSLRRASFTESSGDKTTDTICLDAIRKSAPFPSLEDAIDMDSIIVNCRFKLSELR